MTTERYWVVGGDYTCMGFRSLRDGSATILGPYHDRTEAQAAWRRVSDENRCKATSRYAITAEKVVLPN